MGQGLTLQSVQAGMDYAANLVALVPNAEIGAPTTMGATFGGDNLAQAIRAYSSYTGAMVSILNTTGSMSATLGGSQRRADDWRLQKDLAFKELAQIDKQILAAEIREAIAKLELENHDKQIENAQEVEDYLHDKYTNQELYNWMVSQVSALYFQAYQLAYGLARRAEKAFQFERGLSSSSYIQFGYWDSLKKGLLSGERLYHDLKRMEITYLDQNKREYELTKHISLAALDPVALVQLKQTNTCFISLPEVLFDLDCPGDYMRRIKNVSLTIPCVTGPYTGVNCTLTLVSSKTRMSTNVDSTYSEEPVGSDPRFAYTYGVVQSIVTSSAQNDSGLFEPNLRDERYLPFEGRGVISEWRIDLPEAFKQFDYDTISDVVLHVRYTAREGGEMLKQESIARLEAGLNEIALTKGRNGLARLFSTRHEFPSEWHRFMHPEVAADSQEITLKLDKRLFPFMLKDRELNVREIMVVLMLENTQVYGEGEQLSITFTHPGSPETDYDLKSQDTTGGQPSMVVPTNFTPNRNPLFTLHRDPLEIAVKIDEISLSSIASDLVEERESKKRLSDQVKDLLFVINYTIT